MSTTVKPKRKVRPMPRKATALSRVPYGEWASGFISRERAKALEFLAVAVPSVSFVNATIPTRIWLGDDGKTHVSMDVIDRDTGKKAAVEFTWDPPPVLTSQAQAIEWIYEIVRYGWVHEINEAMHVDGKRWRDLHDVNGSALPPPGERLP